MSCGCSACAAERARIVLPEEAPSPASVPPPRPAPVAMPSSGALIQFKMDVRPPPNLSDTRVGMILELLRLAHAAAGSPMLLVTDWYRTASENLSRPGSSPTSLHLQGLALDFRADAGGEAVYRAWRRLGYYGLDERNIPGVAPHWHVELKRG